MLSEKPIGLTLNGNEDILAVCASLTEGMHLDDEERRLLRGIKAADASVVDRAVGLVCDGLEPLGDAYMRINSSDERRATGAVYTPDTVASAMVD